MFRAAGGWTMKNIYGSTVTVNADVSHKGDIGANMHYATCEDPANLYGGVYFGRGTTPAARTDYKLESVITSGLTISNVYTFPQLETVDGKYVWSASYVVKNTSTEDIVISEVGYYGQVGRNSSADYLALMERTVLSTPLTIKPGESKLITYKLTFNQSQ